MSVTNVIEVVVIVAALLVTGAALYWGRNLKKEQALFELDGAKEKEEEKEEEAPPPILFGNRTVQVPSWEEAKTRRANAQPFSDPKKYVPAAGTRFVKSLPRFEGTKVIGAGVRGDVLPLCIRGLDSAIAVFLQSVTTVGQEPFLRSDIADGEAGEDAFDLGEIGGHELYARAGEGVYLLLRSNENGRGGASFGPFQLGDLEVVGQRFHEALLALPPGACEASIIKIPYDDSPREVYEVGPEGRRKLA